MKEYGLSCTIEPDTNNSRYIIFVPAFGNDENKELMTISSKRHNNRGYDIKLRSLGNATITGDYRNPPEMPISGYWGKSRIHNLNYYPRSCDAPRMFSDEKLEDVITCLSNKHNGVILINPLEDCVDFYLLLIISKMPKSQRRKLQNIYNKAYGFES